MTSRARVLLALLVVAAAVAVALVLVSRSGCGQGSCRADAADTSAESWTLPALGGSGTVSLAQFRGHPVVADFFASWCTACRDELPEFLAVSRRMPSVRFVGIDSEEYGDGMAMARQTGITAWPLARDVGGSDANGLHEALTQAQGMPITAIYGASGRLLDIHVGAQTGAQLEAALRRLLGNAAT